MQNPDFANVARDPVAGGMTRPAIISKFWIPYWDIIPIVVIPFVVVMITRNIVWGISLPFGLVGLSRAMSSSDHNKRRVMWLSFKSGSKSLRGRRAWGGHSVDPLGRIL